MEMETHLLSLTMCLSDVIPSERESNTTETRRRRSVIRTQHEHQHQHQHRTGKRNHVVNSNNSLLEIPSLVDHIKTKSQQTHCKDDLHSPPHHRVLGLADPSGRNIEVINFIRRRLKLVHKAPDHKEQYLHAYDHG